MTELLTQTQQTKQRGPQIGSTISSKTIKAATMTGPSKASWKSDMATSPSENDEANTHVEQKEEPWIVAQAGERRRLLKWWRRLWRLLCGS